MSNITNSQMIDARVLQLRSLINDRATAEWLNLLAQAIDAYRAEVAKEIEGLKGDVKSAESAYEREKVRADGLAQEKDRWTNECLPGWRKRVSESERKERETRAAYDSNVAELKALALHARDLEQDRDEWKRDAATSETKLEKAIEERGEYKALAARSEEDRGEWVRDYAKLRAESEKQKTELHDLRKALYEERGGKTAVQLEGENASLKKQVENLGGQVSFLKQWVQDLQAGQDVKYSVDLTPFSVPGILINTHAQACAAKPEDVVGFTPMTPREFGEKFFGTDAGDSEGDKTVIVFECCNVKHTFSPPKSMQWTHTAECHECGAKTTINS